MTQCRILLADDHPPDPGLPLRNAKARHDLVDVATDGMVALDALQRDGGMVDLLITDIKMPRMDGVSLARAVAQKLQRLPVLFISGWADSLDQPEWRKPQYAFLRKPFLSKGLSVALRNCSRDRRQHSPRQA